jgi:hypothetical protein
MPIQERIVCPRCRHIFNPADQVVIDTTLAVWQAAGPKFWRGNRMTIRAVADAAHVSWSTARRHLLRLHEVGLVEIVPLGDPADNGRRTKHAYRGCMFATKLPV